MVDVVDMFLAEKFKHMTLKNIDVEYLQQIKFFRVETNSGIVICFFLNPRTNSIEEVPLTTWPPSFSDINYVNIITGNKQKLLSHITT